MLAYLLFGIGYGFAAVAQPGPLQAFLLAEVARRGWRRTLPAALAPLLSDGPVAVIALLVLRGLPEGAGRAVRIAGGLFLLYLAWCAYRDWKGPRGAGGEERGAAPATLLKATLINILNPNPYLGWSLVLGPMVFKAWGESHAAAVALLAAFYGAIVLGLAATIYLFGTARLLGARGQRLLLLLSAVALAVLAAYMIASGLLPAS